jgi:predicted ester cyclase
VNGGEEARSSMIRPARYRGKAALRSYFQRGLEAHPNLRFELLDVMCGLRSVVLYYVNQKGSKTGEYMELGPTGRVSRVVANYNG